MHLLDLSNSVFMFGALISMLEFKCFKSLKENQTKSNAKDTADSTVTRTYIAIVEPLLI